MRRAQSEGIGLAIIVLLLIIGFVVFFLYSPTDMDDPRRESANMMLRQFSHVFLQAEVQYGTDNNCKRTVFALIEDVHARGITSLGCGELRTADELLNNTLESYLNNTLRLWGYNSYFEIKRNTVSLYNWSSTGNHMNNPCADSRIGIRRENLAGSITVDTSLC